MAEKRFYWLKLKENYFNSPKIKKLRKIAGGDTYTIIYLKMQLLSIKNNGIIEFEKIEPTFQEELALKLDEDVENVSVTLAYLQAQGLIDMNDNNEFLLLEASNNIGSESESAERVRQFRERENQKVLKEPKSNALRQRQFRAKEICSQSQHIPLIEDYINNKRYNGNYYLVFKRDEMKCAICGKVENLCVHHINGFDENKPENSNENKMITLCRECHSQVHSKSLEIPKLKLESIGYFDECNESNEMCNESVTEVKRTSISNSISKSLDYNNKEENKTKEEKHKYGEYNHVLLTDKELNRLKDEIGEKNTESAIKLLDEAIEMKGYKYKSHYLAIRKWVLTSLKQQGKWVDVPVKSVKVITDEEEKAKKELDEKFKKDPNAEKEFAEFMKSRKLDTNIFKEF